METAHEVPDFAIPLEPAFFRVLHLLFRGVKDPLLGDLPGAQVRCLMAIGMHEGLKMQDLAVLMETTLPATSQIVDRLVKRDLLERRDDVLDRRVVRLHLKPQARQAVEAAHQAQRTKIEATIAILQEQNALEQSVGRIAHVWRCA